MVHRPAAFRECSGFLTAHSAPMQVTPVIINEMRSGRIGKIEAMLHELAHVHAQPITM
jgi:hypothetical protein